MAIEQIDQSSSPAATMVRTFLIADVRGYTRFTNENGDEAAARLADRFAVTAKAIVEHWEGDLIELRGDEALAVFESPRQSFQAALHLQKTFRLEMEADPTLPLRVGIGIDAGEAIPVQGGFRGGALNLAARLCSIAGPGEVFASEGVVHLARKMDGLVYLPRGEVTLKGLPKPVPVMQVVPEDAVPENVQIFGLPAPNNLPKQPTVFMGRERDVSAVCEMLRQEEVRLLTLSGPGGTGKTRLSLHVAEVFLDEFSDGVFFVSLDPVTDPSLVSSAIALAVGVQESGDQPLVETLQNHLGEKKTLLVIDNFEHLLPGATVVSELLSGCPGLKVLVTSRTVLHEYGEFDYPVPPLAIPDPDHLPEFEVLAHYDAVALFVARAQAAKPSFILTKDNARAVVDICARLDGLPLALELAAARTRILPPAALLARLDSRLKLLTGGGSNRPGRQQTLRGAIDWSYSLLEESEQRLFARISVFGDGCTIESAEAICNPDSDPNLDILDGVASLTEKSLLRQEGEDEPRFRMLETIREYATEKLSETPDAEDVHRGHAEYFTAFAEEAASELRGPSQANWLNRLEVELGNLRAALDWIKSRDEAEMGLRLLIPLFPFWDGRGHLSEGQSNAEDLLARIAEVDSSVRAQALWVAAVLAYRRGELERAGSRWSESLQLFREIEDQSGISRALNGLAFWERDRGNLTAAEELWEEGLQIAVAARDPRAVANISGNLSGLAQMQGNLDRAVKLGEDALTHYRKEGDVSTTAHVLCNLAELSVEQGNLARARVLLQESVCLAHEVGFRLVMILCLEVMADIALREHDTNRLAWLLGAIEMARETIGALREPQDIARHARWMQAVQNMDQTAFDGAWQRGRAQSLEQAVQEAFGVEAPAAGDFASRA